MDARSGRISACPINVLALGEIQGEYLMSALGPYDCRGIEFAYEPLDAEEENCRWRCAVR
ncbi:MAG: hypothetical protein HYZ65_15885 [Burkholderiales bacterium]|nr:hypothetical protein [Burkholderiales bacterium]